MDDAEALILQSLARAREESKKCAFTIIKHVGEEHLKRKYLAELEDVLVTCAAAEHKVDLARQAAKNTKNIENNEADKAGEYYDECLQTLENQSNLDDVIDRSPSVRDFRAQLINHESVSRNDEDADGDLVVTQQEMNIIDPISMTVMTDPVRNKVCGHVYERTSVVKMIKQKKHKGFRCPNLGCNHREPLKIDDLEDALDVKREIIRRKQ